MRAKMILVVVILALGLATAACSSGGSNGSDGSGGSPNSGGGGGSGTAAITISNFAFSPDTLSGSAGETLKITVTNDDTTTHSFTADDGSVTQDIPGGQSATVTVTLPSSGTLGWHCRFHPSMTGTITVG